MKYCIDPANYERFPSREVKIGDIILGAGNPIRLQSMTTTPTLDTMATVAQAIKIFDAGADFVRITTPGIAEAENLSEIKKQLALAGYNKPLIADVHFNPLVAETAARIVEKVRINPGNYVDRKRNSEVNYTDVEYRAELELIHRRLLPLIAICREHGTAIRVGSNHGSLSDRIVQRYGNTVEGMVEAAIEFISMFVAESFYRLVISMKASDVNTTVRACRLLNARMLERGWNFPQHLGVTEAGEGEDGRIKSALGIGALLNDGIGDTIRVSLTEAPENEIPFARSLTNEFNNRKAKIHTLPLHQLPYEAYSGNNTNLLSDPFARKCVVIAENQDFKNIPGFLQPEIDLLAYNNENHSKTPYIQKLSSGSVPEVYHVIEASAISGQAVSPVALATGKLMIVMCLTDLQKIKAFLLKNTDRCCIVLQTSTQYPAGEVRYLYKALKDFGIRVPVIVKYTISSSSNENNIIESALYPGSVLVDRIVNGIWPVFLPQAVPDYSSVFSMLQSLGLRYTKAEFVSCPACGRTNYDIETIVKQVKIRFSHLKGIKIAVMGCVVNGPGEMNDADYGYVGAQKGMVHLYCGQKAVLKNVPENKAIEALIGLIKDNGDWIEPNYSYEPL